EHRGGRLGDGAAHPLPADLLDHRRRAGDVQVHPQPDLVPAGGVDLEGLPRIPDDQPVPVPFRGVVQDHLLVELGHRVVHHGLPKNSWTRARWSAKWSISSMVVCTPTDARAEDCAPRRRCSGCAQWCPTRIAIPASSSSWPTSCGCTPSTTNATTPIRSCGVLGPRMCTPSVVRTRSSRYAVSSASWAASADMPSSAR